MGIAASSGAQLVVFPELSLTGYELDLACDLAFSENDPRLCPLLEASSSSSVTLVVGAPVRIGQQMHIGAFIIRRDQTTAIYTKRRLGAFPPSASCDGIVPPAEATVFSPGDRDPLIQVSGRIASVAICADIGEPSHPEQAARRGATIYLASMFVIPSEFDGDVARLEGYSAMHSMVVALANYGSPSGGLTSAGRSTIWSASGDLLAQLPSSGSGVAVVTEARRRLAHKVVHGPRPDDRIVRTG